jgi:acyl dehydratase
VTVAPSSDHGRITEAALADLRSWLGVERLDRGWNSVAPADSIWHFAQGVGDDNPLWWDAAYGGHSRWGGLVAPPLFVSTCSNAGPRLGEHGMYPAESWLPGTVPLWVSDRWVFHGLATEGEQITATARLASVEERTTRNGQPMVTHIDHTTYTGSDGSVLAECFKTLNRYERQAQTASSEPPESPRPIYTDAQIAQIHDQYASEPGQRRGPQTRFGEDVEVGDELLTLVKGPLTITNIVGFVMGWGSPMCHTNRLVYGYLDEHPGARLLNHRTNIPDTLEGPHWDPVLARAGGMADCYDFGLQRVCWMGHLLTDWAGDDGTVTALEVRLRRPNLVGDTTWITAAVAGLHREEAGMTVTCELVASNQRGEQTASGTASVRLPLRGSSRGARELMPR